MLKIKVWFKDENGEDNEKTLSNLRPRSYMTSWSFEKLMKYIKEELYWNDIEQDSVDVIEFETDYSLQSVVRG